MEFVEENDADIGKRPVVLKPTQQDAFGHEADARAQAGLIIEPDLITDFSAEPGISLPSYPRGDGAGCHTTRLQDDDFSGPGQAGVEEHLGNLCGFAGTGWRDQNEPIAGL